MEAAANSENAKSGERLAGDFVEFLNAKEGGGRASSIDASAMKILGKAAGSVVDLMERGGLPDIDMLMGAGGLAEHSSIPTGTIVTLSGLQKTPEYNGRIVQIESFDVLTKRFGVMLGDTDRETGAAKPKRFSVSEEKVRVHLPLGKRVQIHGLIQKAELNGREAKVKRLSDRGRVVVEVEGGGKSGTELALQSENLKKIGGIQLKSSDRTSLTDCPRNVSVSLLTTPPLRQSDHVLATTNEESDIAAPVAVSSRRARAPAARDAADPANQASTSSTSVIALPNHPITGDGGPPVSRTKEGRIRI